ncbi:S8 family serine peptidase [Mycoplasmopsis agassizii]|uniref:S8 family serine peptidase n=1 Tax=Mycoplasmopsis agassizii TaxID=33922 RepID=UPI00352983C6
MKKSLNKKIFKWMFSVVPLTVAAVLPLSMTTATRSNDFGQTEDNSKLYIEKNTTMSEYIALVENSNSIAELVNQTTFNYRRPEFVESVSTFEEFQKVMEQGANRLDIVFKYNVDKEKIKSYVEKIESTFKDDFETIYAEYTLTFSIAFKNLEDFKKLVVKMMQLNIDYQDLLQVNVHETGRSFEEFSPTSFYDLSHEYHGGTAKIEEFWTNYYPTNKRRYELVGLDHDTLSGARHFVLSQQDRRNKVIVNAGIIEASPEDWKSPLVNRNSPAFQDSNKIIIKGNGRSSELHSHANSVAEIIIGKQGLNPHISLFSEQTGNWNGWLNSSLNWFLQNKVHIVNNSWKIKNNLVESYNDDSAWLDNFLNANEDFIFIIASGNDYRKTFEDKKTNKIYKLDYMDGYNLSQNAINVSALELEERVNPAPFTEKSKDDGYITTSVPDSFLATNSYITDRGTSFAAPTVTAMATFMRANYEYLFRKGSDYLIFKSALISGSRNNSVSARFDSSTGAGLHDVYDKRVGFGRANYKKMSESIFNLEYFRIFANGREKSKSQTERTLREGKRYRANITWKGQDLYKTRWVNDFLFFGHTEYEYVGPINLNLQITTPDGKKINAVKIYKETKWGEQVMNTETIEFETKLLGVYKFEVIYDPYEENGRKRDLDVAFTYSEL